MKTIIVTGGNRGIGLEICRQLDALGHQVIMGSRVIQNGIEAGRGLSERLIIKQLDVTDENSVGSFAKAVEEAYGKVDVLINNAGLGSTHFNNSVSSSKAKSIIKKNLPGAGNLAKLLKPVLQNAGLIDKPATASNISLDEAEQIMQTNFYGPWRMIQACIHLLKKNEGGRIINISSGMGELNTLDGDYPGYRLSKSSLNALTIMLSKELGAKNITVNAMCPGWVKTDMGGPDAPREVKEGADTAVWLATEATIPSGKFFRDRKIIDW
jgi:NAD(P)-dependent dehydrogenase (short-subunit alcohol dehydrogenase family)